MAPTQTGLIDIPVYDFSEITEQLYIAVRPRARHVEHLRGIGVTLVLNMVWSAPSKAFSHPPVHVRWLPLVDHPCFPIPLWVLRRGVEAALPVLAVGGKVFVYCRAGMHRSVAMACCILIARGMTADEAMDLVVEKRAAADPHAPHIERRIRAVERDWRARRADGPPASDTSM
jgi:hypothetical protein